MSNHHNNRMGFRIKFHGLIQLHLELNLTSLIANVLKMLLSLTEKTITIKINIFSRCALNIYLTNS